MSDSFWPHGLQHASPPCPSPTSGVYPSSCPSSQWCHPTISSSVVPFFSCPQSFPASGSFQMSQLFTSGGQSIRVSASLTVLPMNTQDWNGVVGFPCSPKDSQESSQTPQFKSTSSLAIIPFYSWLNRDWAFCASEKHQITWRNALVTESFVYDTRHTVGASLTLTNRSTSAVLSSEPWAGDTLPSLSPGFLVCVMGLIQPTLESFYFFLPYFFYWGNIGL